MMGYIPYVNESFTNQKRRVATKEEVESRWSDRMGLYCHLCNRKIKVGEGWRWVYANDQATSFGNFMVCDACDGPDVKDRYQRACELVQKSMEGHGAGHWPVDLAAKLLDIERTRYSITTKICRWCFKRIWIKPGETTYFDGRDYWCTGDSRYAGNQHVPLVLDMQDWFHEALELLWLYRDGYLPDDVASSFLEKTLNIPSMQDCRCVNPNSHPPRAVKDDPAITELVNLAKFEDACECNPRVEVLVRFLRLKGYTVWADMVTSLKKQLDELKKEPKEFERGQKVIVEHERYHGKGTVMYDTGRRRRMIGVLLGNGNVWEYEIETVKLDEENDGGIGK